MPLLGASPLAVPEASNLEGAFQEPVRIPAQPTGQGWSRTTPGDTYEQVITVNTTLTTSVAVANRSVELVFQDASGINYCVAPASAVQTAGQSMNYSFSTASAGSYFSGGNVFVVSMPPLLMFPGHKLFLVVVNMDAADALGASGLSLFRVPTARPQLVLVRPIATPQLA